MLGILGNMGYNFNAGLLRGIGNSSSSLLLLFISCAANIVLDLVLTGALGLGIGGVAAATAIALFLSWICSIFTFAAAAQSLRCLFCPAALMPAPCVRLCASVCRWG